MASGLRMVLAARWGSSGCAEGLGTSRGARWDPPGEWRGVQAPTPAIEVQQAWGPSAAGWHTGGPGDTQVALASVMAEKMLQQDLASGAISVAQRR